MANSSLSTLTVLLGMAACAMGSLLLAGPAMAETLGNEVSLGYNGEKLDMDVDGNGNLHLVYKRGSTVYYTRQVNGSWEGIEREVPGSSSTYNSRFYPRIGVDSGGTAHFAWADNYMTHVYHNSFNGSSWSGLTTAIGDQISGSDTNRCDLTVDRNGTAIVCAQSDFAIECAFKPVGSGFGGEYTLAYNPSEPKNPHLGAAPNSNNVVVTYANNGWPSNGLQYNVWSGSGWGSNQRPGGNGGPCCANNGSTFIDGYGAAHMAWVIWASSTAEYSTLFYIGQDASGAWGSLKTLISQSHYFTCWLDECPIPQVAVADNGSVLVLFADGSDTSRTYYFINEASKSWTTSPTEITTNSTYQNYPAMAVYGNTFYAAWSDNRGGGTLYVRSIATAGTGPSCDCPDTDGDGVPDAWDNCPGTPGNTYVNSQGCAGKEVPLMHNTWTAVLLGLMTIMFVVVRRKQRKGEKAVSVER